MHVPCCITIMMSPFVIACYYEKCRILETMDFVPALTLVALRRLLWKQKLATRVIYIWNAKVFSACPPCLLDYLHPTDET